MNKLLLLLGIASLCIILSGCVEKPKLIDLDIEDFLGITWGENWSTAVSILNKNNFWIIPWDDIITEIEGILHTGRYEGIFLNEEIYLRLGFSNDRFFSVDIRFKNEDDQFELYNQTIDLLTEKYGEPSSISTNDFVPVAHWHFRNNCTIQISFSHFTNSIRLWYINFTIR